MIKVRPIQDEDINFIYSSWVKGYAGLYRSQPRWAVYTLQMSIIRELVSMCEVLVATPDGDEDQIAGWLCYEWDVYHFCYVKSPFRRFGVARTLLEASGVKDSIKVTVEPPRWLNSLINVGYVPQLGRADMLREYGNVQGSDGSI